MNASLFYSTSSQKGIDPSDGIDRIKMGVIEKNELLTPGQSVKREFPFFAKHQNSSYLDSAATTQKPSAVIESLCESMSFFNANVHRGAYHLSALASERYLEARKEIAEYIGARSSDNLIFVRGATEGINTIAWGFEHLINPGDVILLSLLEHHSNIVPWQMLATRRGATVKFVGITSNGSLDVDDFKAKVNQFSPKIVSITQLANSIGTVTPIKELVDIGRTAGACVVVDGSQGVVHLGVDVEQLGCDFYVFSGHKMYGPTGIGVLYGRRERLEQLQPLQGGGDMISFVTVEGFGLADIPQRFEAGTPAFHEAIALGAAVRFLRKFSADGIRKHEADLMQKGWEMLCAEDGVTLYGPGPAGERQAGAISFEVDGVHPHDFATIADSLNVQVRAGNHCAMPTLTALGVTATIRASFGLYSTEADLQQLISAIRKARKMFA